MNAQVIKNMSDEDYFAHPALSQSKLKPYITGMEKEYSLETRTVGHALEVALFEGVDALKSKYEKSKYKSYCDSMGKEAEVCGKKMLNEEHWEWLTTIHAHAKQQDPETYFDLMLPGDEQVTVLFKKEGLQFKVRFDKVLLTKDACMIYDLKTFAKKDVITANSLGYSICKPYGYDIQASLYVEAAMQAYNLPRERVRFGNIFFGKWINGPILPCEIGDSNIEAAEIKILYGIKKYKQHAPFGTKPTVAEIELDKQCAGRQRSRFLKLSWYDDNVPEEILL